MPPVRGRHPGAANGKIRVAQAKAEGIRRLHAEAVEEPVAHVDAFLVELILEIAVEIAVFLGEGEIGVPSGPGVRELARGGHRAAEHIGKGVTALLPQLAEIENGVDAGNGANTRHIQRGAAVDHQQEMLIPLRAEADGGLLPGGEKQIPALRPAVPILPRLTAEHIDAGIRIAVRRVPLRDRPSGGRLEAAEEQFPEGLGPQGIEIFPHLLHAPGPGLLQARLIVLQPPPGCDGEAPVLQPLQNGDGMALIDLSGAGAPLDGGNSAGAVEGRLFCPEGQGPIVFQQHHSLAGGLIGDPQIVLFPPGRLIGIAGFGQRFHTRLLPSSRFRYGNMFSGGCQQGGGPRYFPVRISLTRPRSISSST